MQQIEKIANKIIEASNAYYNDMPILSDEQFDALKDQLKQLDPNHPILYKIGADIDNKSEWQKHKHIIPMTSLNKAQTIDEFRKWFNDCYSTVTMSLKLDGLSCDLLYNKGRLVCGSSRGDGIYGEDLTKNIIKIQNVKQYIPEISHLDSVSFRGEIIIRQSDFNKLNDILKKNNEKNYKNKRNTASGIVRDLKGTYCHFLSMIYYDTTYETKTASERFKFIKKLGLPIALIKDDIWLEDCITIYNDYQDKIRSVLDFDIDGIVCEVNDLKKKKSLGQLYGNPRGSIAWKFKSLQVETIVQDIEWQLGNSSRITPVCIVKPVDIYGVTVSRVTLHNIDLFNFYELRKNDKVLICRSNDVIPTFVSVIEHTNNEKFPIIDKCPVCHSSTKIDGKFLICDNSICKGKIIGDVLTWCQNLDLKGISRITIEILVNHEFVHEPSDLYGFTAKQLRDFIGFGPVMSENIYNIIHSKKEVTLPEFIGGLNLKQFGNRMTELLINEGYDTINKILDIQECQLVKIKGIDIKTARIFLKEIQRKKDIILHLLDAGITIKPKENMIIKNINSKINGKSFVFTGTIEKIDENGNRYTRERLQKIVVENGGKISSSISKDVDYLVQADVNSNSSKTQKAKKYGINIISEKDFFNMCKSQN